MVKELGSHRHVLFLCTGNYYRSRFAEIVFNHVAVRMNLNWRATSRGLAIERGIHNVGPISSEVLSQLAAMRIVSAECQRMPASVLVADFESAERIVALDDDEHRPLMRERFPAFEAQTEYCRIVDKPGVLPAIEEEVMRFIAGLMGGGGPEPIAPIAEPSAVKTVRRIARVSRETKGRRGKGVTIVDDLVLGEAELRELGATLKNRCGTGGTVKEGRIEIQGDQRERVAGELERMGYKVKSAGG